MVWPRIGQGGKSGTSAIQTAPPWMKPTMPVYKQNDKKGTYAIKTNYYKALIEQHEDNGNGEPALTNISMREETTTTNRQEPKAMPTANNKATRRKRGNCIKKNPDGGERGGIKATGDAATKMTIATKTTMQQMPEVAVAMEKPAMLAETKKTTKTVIGNTIFTQFVRYKQWLVIQQGD